MITWRSRYVGVLLLVLGLSGTGCDHPLPTEQSFDNNIQFGMNAACRLENFTEGWMLTLTMFDSIPSNSVFYIYKGELFIQGTRTTTDNGILGSPRYVESYDSIMTIKLATPDGAEYVATSPMAKAVTDYTFSLASRTTGVAVTLPRPMIGGEKLVAIVYRNGPSGWIKAYSDSSSVVGSSSLVLPADIVRAYEWNGMLRVGAQFSGTFTSDGFPGGATFTWQHKSVIDTAQVVP